MKYKPQKACQVLTVDLFFQEPSKEDLEGSHLTFDFCRTLKGSFKNSIRGLIDVQGFAFVRVFPADFEKRYKALTASVLRDMGSDLGY